MKTTGHARGFTLIELLVVIAVVAVLAGLIFPALNSATESGHQTKCMNNLKQIFGATQSYLQDNNNLLMQRFTGPEMWNGYDKLLLPYLDQTPNATPPTSQIAAKIFTCPSQPPDKTDYPNQPAYGMNWYYDNTMVTRVERPSQTILLAETAGSFGTGSHRADRENSPGDIGALDTARHRGKAQYLFFDGHVAMLTFAETKVPLDPGGTTDMWGTDNGNHGDTTQ